MEFIKYNSFFQIEAADRQFEGERGSFWKSDQFWSGHPQPDQQPGIHLRCGAVRRSQI